MWYQHVDASQLYYSDGKSTDIKLFECKFFLVFYDNRGSVIARIIGANVTAQPELFDKTVNIHVYEEMVDGKKLTEIINTQHENVKYLPGYKVRELLPLVL